MADEKMQTEFPSRDQRLAVCNSINETSSFDEDTESKQVSTVPPQAARENAREGLRLREEWNRGGLSPSEARERGIRSGVNTAERISSGEALDRDLISSMASFARFEEDADPEEEASDGGPTAAWIAWQLWGGTEGIEWAQETLEKLDEENMEKNHTKAEPGELNVGDFVRWDAGPGFAQGEIVEIQTEGEMNVPGADFSLEASEEDPAALIRIYRPVDESEEIWRPVDEFAGHRFSTLTQIDPLNTLEEDDYNPRAEVKRTHGMGIGDFVKLDIGPSTEVGKIVEVIRFGRINIPGSERVIEGSRQNPAAIIRLYEMNFHNRLVPTETLTGRHFDEITKLERIDRFQSPGNHHDDDMTMSEMEGRSASTDKEYKNIPFKVTETKEAHNKKGNYGIVKGFASTFGNIDRGNDRIVQGAFQKSIDRYKSMHRPVKMFYQHDSNEIIGGFPVEEMKETHEGLEVTGQINLDVQRGREAYALAKQGVLTDFSIGYTVGDYDIVDHGVRELKELDLWEISLVGEPMNTMARVTDVKRATSFQDLPLAPQSREWSADDAVQRIRDFTNSNEEPSDSYRRAFMWFDETEPRNFTSYKLPYADVIDGQLRAVPRAIFAIAAALEGARGGVDIPENEKAAVRRHVERYYDKMGMESPFNNQAGKRPTYEYKDIQNIETKKEFEKVLRDSGAFSRKAATYLASFFDEKQSDSVISHEQYNELKYLINQLRGKK
jgi:HK97 family phage prohead protease